MVWDRWVDNHGVNIHYLDSRDKAADERLPLVYLPGLLAPAESFRDEMKRLLPRRALAISFRGRGKSGRPLTGYGLEEHVSDAEAVVADAELDRFMLMAYSCGVPIAIEWAARNPRRIAGLLLLDYGPRNKRIPEGWVDKVMANPFPGPAPEAILRAIQQEAAEVDLSDRLPRITCPTWVLYGGATGSLLTENEAERYQTQLPQVELIQFKDSGHELWVPDYERFMKTIEAILDQADAEVVGGEIETDESGKEDHSSAGAAGLESLSEPEKHGVG